MWGNENQPEEILQVQSRAANLNACGAADIISEMYGDDDDDEVITTQPVYMGGPIVSDDVLFRRLNDRLLDFH